jgi:hypothetical protein
MSERISSGNSSNGLLALKGVNIRVQLIIII